MPPSGGPVQCDVGILALVAEPWGGMWLSRQQILTRLARWFPVVWLDPARSWRRLLRRRGRGPVGLADATPAGAPGFGLVRQSAWTPGFYRPRTLARAMRRAHLARGLAALHRMGCRRVVLYAWRPEFVDWLDLVDADLVCYHVADEYSFEAVERPIDARERAMLERADQVFIHSPALMEKKGRINPHTAFVTNGVDYEAFATPRPEPEDLRPIRRPRLGYVGRIKTQLDWNVLEALARTHPDWSLVFVGPEGAPGPWRERWQALRTLPNVHWLGARTVDAIAPYVQHVDVGLLCYRVDAYTRYIYPLKLHEFLAAGVPVVGSDIPSLRRFDDTIAIAAGVEGWERSVRTALDARSRTPDRVAARRRVARAHDWNAIAARIASILASRMRLDLPLACAAEAPREETR